MKSKRGSLSTQPRVLRFKAVLKYCAIGLLAFIGQQSFAAPRIGVEKMATTRHVSVLLSEYSTRNTICCLQLPLQSSPFPLEGSSSIDELEDDCDDFNLSDTHQSLERLCFIPFERIPFLPRASSIRGTIGIPLFVLHRNWKSDLS
jgi:hypothetical protein